MIKLIISIVISLAASGSLFAQEIASNLELPELHKIKSVTLAPPYSCRSSREFQKGYEGTALFLSANSKQRNSPDLLFNGACRSGNYFEASTAGDDMSLIADLGENVVLDEVSASSAFYLRKIGEHSKFTKSAKVLADHTYAVLLNGKDKRGLFVFRVVNYVPDVKVELEYSVKSYQINSRDITVSPDFDWVKKSERTTVETN